MPIEVFLQIALTMRKEQKYISSNKILKHLAAMHPDDAYINYQCAWSFEKINKKVEAIRYYESAISKGIANDLLINAYLALSSIYRMMGDFESSKSILEEGMTQFPENKSLQLFYTLTLNKLSPKFALMHLFKNYNLNSKIDNTPSN